MSVFNIDLTSAYTYVWNLCLEVWRFSDNIHITLGPVNFTLFELFISLIALDIIWFLFLKIMSWDYIGD